MLFSILRTSLTTASTTESQSTPQRRSSGLVIPEGKPTFAQALESELLINEEEPLT